MAVRSTQLYMGHSAPWGIINGRQNRPDYKVRARGGALRVMLKGIVTSCCVRDLRDLIRYMMWRRRPMAAHLYMVRCQIFFNRESTLAYIPNLRQRRESPHIEPALTRVSRLRFVIYGVRQQYENPVCFLIAVRSARSKARRDNTEIEIQPPS